MNSHSASAACACTAEINRTREALVDKVEVEEHPVRKRRVGRTIVRRRIPAREKAVFLSFMNTSALYAVTAQERKAFLSS
jgi:hypothetical protein